MSQYEIGNCSISDKVSYLSKGTFNKSQVTISNSIGFSVDLLECVKGATTI